MKFFCTLVISKIGNEFVTTFIYGSKKVIDVNLKTCYTTMIATCSTINMIINFTKFVLGPAPLN